MELVLERAAVSRVRARVVFILLVLILLVASALFAVLTYWLNGELLPASGLDGQTRSPCAQCREQRWETGLCPRIVHTVGTRPQY
jgi:hypothetical protein